MITDKTSLSIKTKNGLNVSVEFTDSETALKYFKTFSFVSQREVDHDLKNRIAQAKVNITAKIADSKIKKEWSREELEILLVEKKLIVEGETVEDLKAAIEEVK